MGPATTGKRFSRNLTVSAQRISLSLGRKGRKRSTGMSEKKPEVANVL